MGSSRLPGKTLKLINGKIPMLQFQLNQLRFSKLIDNLEYIGNKPNSYIPSLVSNKKTWRKN